MSGPGTTEETTLSAECTLAKHPDYPGMHDWCRQTKDVPLPHGGGLLLMARCRCACHWSTASTP